MKNILVLSFSLLVLGPMAFAHDTVYQLDSGKIDVSMYWMVADGMNADVFFMENSLGELTNFGYHVLSSRFNAGSSGLVSLFEIGATPQLSLGLRLNFPQFIIRGLSNAGYNLTSSFFGKWLIGESARLGIQMLLELEGTSILGQRELMSHTDGYFNFFMDLSSYYHLTKKSGNAMSIYLDAKAMTTLENPMYRDPVSGFERMLGYPPGSCASIPAQTGPIFRFALAPGLEAKLGKFIFHLGFNFPIVSFHKYYVTSVFFKGLFPPDITNLEFGWRYRF